MQQPPQEETPPLDLPLLRTQYAAQLEELHMMGVHRDDEALQLLAHSGGDVEYVMNLLLDE